MLLLFALLFTDWKADFAVDRKNLGPTGRNEYFILEPGYRLQFARGGLRATMTVLKETATIDGVETRVVEDREEKNGTLIEVTRDYYAIDRLTGDVYYFGEDVDNYKNGKVNGHKGSWRSGVDGARFGLMMPAKPQTGQAFYQERAPNQKAVDRSRILSAEARLTTPAGSFDRCVRVKDSSEVERGGDEKWYAPGVGLVKDGKMTLVKIEKP